MKFFSVNIMNDLCLGLRSSSVSVAGEKSHDQEVCRCLVIDFLCAPYVFKIQMLVLVWSLTMPVCLVESLNSWSCGPVCSTLK